jgi:hypothetical protein
MRTTVRLDDALLRAAKAEAARSGRTLTALIEDALRAALRRRRTKRDDAAVVSLATFKGNGLCAGVDLDDSAALNDLMDEPGVPV